jgi:ATP-binding cassette subfamily B protein/subfamily B ATP-binding cassette protein MsbA
MSKPSDSHHRHARSSRQRYKHFVLDYRDRRLDDRTDEASGKRPIAGDVKPEAGATERVKPALLGGKRREYLREYLRWLWPHRYGVAALFALALIGTGLQMIEPLFMRFIIDRVLLNTSLDTATRLNRLNLAGFTFLSVIILASLVGIMRDYRQRLLNTQVMLSLRRSLFDRLLHLPLQKLWDMKTGGILSRLTGDVDTTSGLLQGAIVSPSVSFIRLFIAIGVLLALNWRLAIMAVMVIPGAMLISFVFARRVRPIYRAVRKDVEEIDGRVGETFSGIRVVRAFGREKRELLD